MTFGSKAGAIAMSLVLVGAGFAQAGGVTDDAAFDDPKMAREASPPRPIVGRGTASPADASAAVKSAPAASVATKSAAVASAAAVSAAPAASVATKPAAVASAPHAPAPVVPAAPAVPAIPAVPAASSPEAPSSEIAPAAAASSAPGAVPDAAAAPAPGAVDVSAHAQPPTTPIIPPPATASGAWPYAPVLKLAYRHFPFSHIGATSSTTTAGTAALGPATPESFESLSLDLYPISWYLRVGLSSQFGWQTGAFDRSRDYFFAESASVGFQIPGRFTPFAEVLAGAGYMRRRQADTTLPSAYWQLGVDVGVEIYVAGRAYASLAIGYLHPGNLFVMQQSLMSVNLDTWSLKLGFGI